MGGVPVTWAGAIWHKIALSVQKEQFPDSNDLYFPRDESFRYLHGGPSNETFGLARSGSGPRRAKATLGTRSIPGSYAI